MTDSVRKQLGEAAARFGTPAYVYFVDAIAQRIADTRAAFDNRFAISYAVKANPNVALLTRMLSHVDTLDVSSIGEVDRALSAGCPAERLTFSGPVKREADMARAVELGVGEMVCESPWELERLNELAAAAGITLPVFVRINPKRAPRGFGGSMAGRASQFGIDEEDLSPVLDRFAHWPSLKLDGLHIYSGTNCLKPDAIAENFAIFIELFTRFSESHNLRPRKLIFGSGFGVPYHEGEQPLDLAATAGLVNPLIDEFKSRAPFTDAECVLEMGRYLVGPFGYLLTRVINAKRSRGVEIRMCDAGFNCHLSACGMMGSVIRRNWRFLKVTGDNNTGDTQRVDLTGPLCTTIDTLAQNVDLPPLERGDVLAVQSSGAYGLTASPTGFISHAPPREILVEGEDNDSQLIDVTESVTPISIR